jgi:hypothetical protein
MKIGKSCATGAFLSLTFIGLFVLGIPVAGFAQTPHSCPGGNHLPDSLGGVQQADFDLWRDCSPDSSRAIRWKAWIYNGNGAVLCQINEEAVPAGLKHLWHCGPTPNPLTATMTVTVSYKTSTLGSWMTHTHNVTNP